MAFVCHLQHLAERSAKNCIATGGFQMRSNAKSVFITSVLCAVVSGPLAAQEGSSLALEEIVVTAQKRVESLTEVPVAVSVVSGRELERAQVRDLTDLQQLAPTLVLNSTTGSTQTILTIRGIGTAGQNTGLEQSVGVFIDGVYRGRVGAAMSDLMDLEQVEVLRGPQSTLFGKNTSAGVISVTTRKPSYEFGGMVEAGVGDFGLQQLRGSVTGPLIGESVAYRLAASYQKHDGFVEDPRTGREYNNRDRVMARAQILWDISDASSLRLIGDYTGTDEQCCAAIQEFAGPVQGVVALLGGPGAVAGLAGRLDPFTYEQALSPGVDVDNSFIDGGFSAEFNHDFAGSTFTAIGAHRFYETFPRVDTDFQAMDLLSDRTQGQDLEEQSFELRLASNGDGDVEWLVGGYAFNQTILATDDLILGADGRAYGDLLTQAATGGALSFPALEAIFGLPAGSIFANGTGTRNTFDYEASGFAIFGQATWYIDDQWSITAGLRYSDEEKDSDAVNTLANEPLSNIPLPPSLAGLSTFQVFPGVAPYTSSFSDDNVTGTFNVSYDVNDAVSTYLRYATGFKSGGINLSRNAAGQAPGNPTPNVDSSIFDSETVESLELGVKTRIAGGRATINAALFSQTLDDFQANSFDGLSFTVRNAAEVEAQGLEIDYDWLVTDSLQIKGGAILQDITYESFPGASATAAQNDAGIFVQDLSGRTPNFVSKVTLTTSLIFNHPLTETINLVASADGRYRSEFFTGQDLDPRSFQDSGLFVLNASLGIENADGNWAIQAWVKNATDEEIFNVVFDSPFQAGSFHAFVDAPQTSGITATYRF